MLKIKNNLSAMSVLTIIFVFSLVLAADTKAVQNQNMNQGQNEEMNQEQNTSTAGQQNQEQNQEMIQEQNKEQNQEQNQEQNKEQSQKQQGQINAEQHRSTVANFVQSILQIADREEGIGQQVRVIAQQQNQSATATIQAMEKVQTRNKVKTFLVGTDYKNLGALRSETVQTRNRLEQLNRLMENVQNEGDKTELQNQIQTLEQEQTRIESFIKAQEGKFSLFGWLVKLFNR